MELKNIAKLAPNNDALDLGCGIGKHSIPLADNGMDITCVDVDSTALKILIDKAHEHKLRERISVICNDIRDFEFKKRYGIILCRNVLHFFRQGIVLDMLKKIKDATAKNGINIISVFTVNGDLSSDKMYFFQKEELKKLYDSWETLEYEEKQVETRERNLDGTTKRHEVASIVARKP
jgi:2-polyprenyl-3-methyl-5-hydroxy-6-metoxy-1,4-benzoquinol methylase